MAIAASATAKGAWAEPTLRVRAETRLEMGATATASGVEVQLTLRDDLGASIAHASVELSLRGPEDTGPTRVVRTGDDGRFVATLRAPANVTEIIAHYPGDATYAATEAQRSIDPAQSDTRLDLSLPGGTDLDLDRAVHPFRVHASSAAGAAGLHLEIFDELDRSLARGVTDGEGDFQGALAASTLGPPGAGRLRARSAGDARRADAQVELPVIRTRRISLTLTLQPRKVEEDGEIRLTGRLFDSAGGLGRRAVGIFGAGAHWGSRLTDEVGNYDLRLPVPADTHGRLVVEARYESEGPGRPDAVSAPTRLTVEAHTSWAWLSLALPLAALLLLVVWGTRPRRARNGRRRVAPVEGTPASVVVAGKAQGRRRQFNILAGRVEDSRDGRPLANASVRVRRGDEVVAESRSSDSGGFQHADLPRATLTLEVDAPGYELSTAAIVVPHRGEWSQTKVRLRSLRWRVAEAFEPVAAEILGSAERAATHTHREAAALSVGSLAPEVNDLAQAVERVAYGADVPERVHAQELAERSGSVARSLRQVPSKPDADS